eukprot:c16768_g1_i2.p1 GENE.c16768_g1_i2~~c16768_g1_i2.p1  ORF type:complete len:347 (+),score=55.95 c16768_g1_i2:35-1075(+)
MPPALLFGLTPLAFGFLAFGLHQGDMHATIPPTLVASLGVLVVLWVWVCWVHISMRNQISELTQTLFRLRTQFSDHDDGEHDFVSPNTPKLRQQLLLVRHGQSEANVQKNIYESTPDHMIPLTEAGWKMAIRAGQEIAKHLEQDRTLIQMWVSPFLRTRQTAAGILEGLGDLAHNVTVRESPLLVEQDWGLFEGTGMEKADEQEKVRLQRITEHQGKFWARFPLGESCFDVCQRVRILFGSMFRAAPVETCIVVSHGITIRAFVMMWCRYSHEWFSKCPNPPNCSIRLLDRASEAVDQGYIFGGFNETSDEPICSELLNKAEPPNSPLETASSFSTTWRWTPKQPH